MIEQLKELLDREPFQPFRIILSNGDHYDVVDPHLLALGQSQIVFCFPRSDRLAYLRMNQIAAMETMPSAA